jgi:hypothetical protein
MAHPIKSALCALDHLTPRRAIGNNANQLGELSLTSRERDVPGKPVAARDKDLPAWASRSTPPTASIGR